MSGTEVDSSPRRAVDNATFDDLSETPYMRGSVVAEVSE